MDHLASLVIAGLSFAFIGWAMLHLAARLKRQRQQRHAERFGEHEPALTQAPAWWLLPAEDYSASLRTARRETHDRPADESDGPRDE